jgi:undecaprenyl-diphosphatase
LSPYLLSVLLGIIEGLTEFLPVSSTAHLRIAEQVFGLDLSNGYWKMYAIVIQLGAILCLPIYFRARIAKFLSTFPTGERGDRTALTHPLTLVMIAFVVTAVPAFLLTKLIGKHLENLSLMAWALIIGGIVMWIVDAVFSKRSRVGHMEEMSLGQASWIGACQILSAVFPGTSRSMSTIAAGQVAGMSRESALEFSFFLSMPTMAAATLYDLLKFLEHDGMGALNGHEWAVLAIGFVVSFLVAWGVVAWFMHWVRRHGFVPFAIYRIVAGIAVLVWLSRLVYP